MNRNKRRPGLTIMRQLIVLVKPLTGIMLLGITLGVLGSLCAIFLTILGGYGLIKGVYAINNMALPSGVSSLAAGSWSHLFTILIIIAVARGILHYGEQYCNHYIAFRILAIIRHKVFATLRRLCPAKLEGKEKGNLVSIITSDIELLEVFFAHTISPIAIAIITSVIMVLFIGSQYWLAGLIALLGYATVGAVLPLINGRRNGSAGMAFRTGMAGMNNFVLESLYGMDEILQYGQGETQLHKIDDKSRQLASQQKALSRYEGSQRAVTNLVIQLFSWVMFFVMLAMYQNHTVTFANMITATLAMLGSFGPVVALSSLSNSLNQTLASGERVLSLLEEDPAVEEVSGRERTQFDGAQVKDVTFAYDDKSEPVLQDVSLPIARGEVLGIHGASGSGKSTLLKLLMRFFDVNSGEIDISNRNVKEINTADLRSMSSYMSQDTFLFHDTIAANIAIAKPDATKEEIEDAARKASIHDFIMRLPDGYDTNVGELGDTLSDGEKQRIGLARAFLHDADFILLDEPTSNLDALNEGIILKSLAMEKDGKTIVLVSHRKSTLSITDHIYEMEKGRLETTGSLEQA